MNACLGLIVLVGSVYLLPVTDATYCYKCHGVVTSSDDECGDAFKGDRSNGYVSMCEGQMCVKMVTETQGTGAKIIERYCAGYSHPETCTHSSNALTKTSVCYCGSDVCNTGVTTRRTVTSLTVLTVLHLLWRIL